ncbi:hypothetical protein ACFL33_04370 [Pseudomonadota bacterium]|jgi:hypothetical protein|nr:hypothetical protein [Xanthomonadales bacterium]
MKNVSNIIRNRTISTVLALWALVACDVLLADDKHIDVTVSGNKLIFLNSECPERPGELGCVMAEYGNSPMISWELTGMGSEQWQFSGLSFNPTPLQDCTVEDFGLSEADRQSGTASTAQIVANGKRLQIRDHNRNQCITQYTLSAVSSEGTYIDSDPVVDNRGGGRH